MNAQRIIRSQGTIARSLLALLLGLTLFMGMTSTSAVPAAAAAGSDHLAAGENLFRDTFLVSPNGQYFLRMQSDGNLVIYAPGNIATWSSGTGGNPEAFLRMQDDGNLVVYSGGGIALGASGTAGRGASTLVMQDDGNLVVYTNTSPRVATWSKATGSLTPSTGDALARQISGNGRITLATTHVSGVIDNANARQNIVDTGNGGLAARSCYGTAPCGRVALNGRMLQAMLTLTNTYSLQVSEIAGASHSPGSLHYAGVAFDVDHINGAQVNAANPNFRALMQRCRDLGAIEVIGPPTKGHETHVHCGWPRL